MMPIPIVFHSPLKRNSYATRPAEAVYGQRTTTTKNKSMFKRPRANKPIVYLEESGEEYEWLNKRQQSAGGKRG